MCDVSSYKILEKAKAKQGRSNWFVVGRALRSTAALKGCAVFPTTGGGLPCTAQPSCCLRRQLPWQGLCPGFSSLPEASPLDLLIAQTVPFLCLGMPKIFLFKKKKIVLFYCFRGARESNLTMLWLFRKFPRWLFLAHTWIGFTPAGLLQGCFQLCWEAALRVHADALPQPLPLGRAEGTRCCPALERKVLFPSPKSWAGSCPQGAGQAQPRGHRRQRDAR